MEFEELSAVRPNGRVSTFDAFSGISEDCRSLENYILVQGFADANPKADVQSKADTLRQLIAVRGAALRSKATIQASLLEKGTETDLSQGDYLLLSDLADKFEGAGSDDVHGEAKTLMGQVEKTQAGDMHELMTLLNEHTEKSAQLNDIYGNFIDMNNADKSVFENDNFRVELLRFLAGNIFVKENRYRYQKEQFDRFIYSQHHS
jgi:hypothetical protein